MDGLAIAAALSELRPAVEGRIIRTAYQPLRDLFVLRVSGGGAKRVLISPKDAAIHLTELDIPNPERPSAFAMLLRKHTRGGRIVAVHQLGWDRIVIFEIRRRHGARVETIQVVAELAGLRGNLLVVRDGIVVGAGRRGQRNRPGSPYEPLAPQGKTDPRTIEPEAIAACLKTADPVAALSKAVDGIGRETAKDLMARVGEAASGSSSANRLREYLDELIRMAERPKASVDVDAGRAAFYPLPSPAERTEAFWQALDRVRGMSVGGGDGAADREVRIRLRRALGRRSRTAEKLREWLDGAASADRLQLEGNLLLIHASEIEARAEAATLIDPATEESIEVRLDPSQSAAENAQRRYERAKRLRRGRPHVERRLRRIEHEIEQITHALEEVDRGRPLPAEAVSFLSRDRAKGPETTEEPPARRFAIEGYAVWVGRNAKENDRLLRDASPDDLWMHARGAPGSHVIVRRGGRAEIPASVVHAAARLAARYSKKEEERRVDVIVAAVKHVRKPKGAPPGLVIVSNEDTLTVDPEPRERE